MAAYECTSCKYKYAPKTGKVPNACPYCASVGTLQPKKGMQDLIDETLSEMED